MGKAFIQHFTVIFTNILKPYSETFSLRTFNISLYCRKYVCVNNFYITPLGKSVLNRRNTKKTRIAPKVNESVGRKQKPVSTDIETVNNSDNIITIVQRGDSQDYIFGRLKRDAELGDEKAIEVVEKVKSGEFKSARQVALEMGYRKPIKQKCLPMDVEKAVDKILKQMGEVYADEFCTALYQRLREIHLQNSED